MKRFTLFFSLLLFVGSTFSQIIKEIPKTNTFSCDLEEIETVDFGINIYDQYSTIVGDKIRYNSDMEPFEGKFEDFYNNKKLLHKGYYVDGKLRSYKNFYPNDQVEREYKYKNEGEGEMKIYYLNGQLRSKQKYHRGEAYQWDDYYDNGKLEFFELKHKTQGYIINSQHNTIDGKPLDLLELIDKDSLLYKKGVFDSKGNLLESGRLKYYTKLSDFRKDGKWITYENGVLVSEEHYKDGVKTNTTVEPTRVLPTNYISFDTDNSGEISTYELDMAINSFFEEDSKMTPSELNSLINFFFDQD